jgi:replicative DNA helicase
LVLRLISSETGIRSESIKKGNLKDHEWAQLHQNVEKLSQAPIYIDDTPALSIFELRAKCRRLKAQYDIQMIVIDYLQLMSAGSDSRGNREQEISAISRSLKSLAKELEVPVIALSQLSRAVETRGGDKKPQLSDLRESGAIEQDADMVIFLYRPQYYKIENFEDGSPTDGIGQVIIAKHRNGSLEDVNLRFIGHLAKFDNLEGGYDPGNAGINPGVSFDDEGQSFMTVGSKMNNDIKPPAPTKSIDDFFNDNEEIPF